MIIFLHVIAEYWLKTQRKPYFLNYVDCLTSLLFSAAQINKYVCVKTH